MAVKQGKRKGIAKKAARVVPTFRTVRTAGAAHRIRGRLRRGRS